LSSAHFTCIILSNFIAQLNRYYYSHHQYHFPDEPTRDATVMGPTYYCASSIKLKISLGTSPHTFFSTGISEVRVHPKMELYMYTHICMSTYICIYVQKSKRQIELNVSKVSVLCPSHQLSYLGLMFAGT
jgi:hypothetical protein